VNDVMLLLMGGPLDGVYVPLTAEAKTSPSQLIAYSPSNATWTNYINVKRRTGAIDVCKIRSDVDLLAERPRGFRIVKMYYAGDASPETAKIVENMARSRVKRAK
jgi:hypothetical protein